MAGRDQGADRAWTGILLVLVVLLTIFGGIMLTMLDAPRQEMPTTVATGPTATPLDAVTPVQPTTIVSLPSPIPSPTATPQPSPTPSPKVVSTPTSVISPTPTETPIEAPTETPTVGATPESTPQGNIIVTEGGDTCAVPADWIPYTIRSGDTLFSLSIQRGVGTDAIKIANCLVTNVLYPGDVLYLPVAPLPTPPRCGPPGDWVLYTVQAGDTLYSLASRRSTTVYEAKFANCLESTYIYAGMPLYLPPLGDPAGASQTATPAPPPSSDTVCSITAPADGDSITGEVVFRGTAAGTDFLFFKLEANGPETGGVWASVLGHVVNTPVQNGVLGAANMAVWAPGTYSVRVVVVDTTSNLAAMCSLTLNVPAP